MKDSNFWIGTGVGFLSALAGAAIVTWLQYKLRIREHKYKRRQEELDRQKQQRAREETERKAMMTMLSDIHGDPESRDRLRKTLGRYVAQERGRSFGRAALLDDSFPEYDLRKMDLAELRVLYTTVINIITLEPAAEAERKELMAQLTNIYKDPEFRDGLKRTLGRYIEQHPRSPFPEAVRRWSLEIYHSEYELNRMNLSELRILCATLVNIISVAPLSETFERAEKMKEQMDQLTGILESLRSVLPQSPADESGKNKNERKIVR